MVLHDKLEKALDDLAPDRWAREAQVEAVLGEGFADRWAAAYATAILRDHIRRGLASRRRYLTTMEKKRLGEPGGIRLKKPGPLKLKPEFVERYQARNEQS